MKKAVIAVCIFTLVLMVGILTPLDSYTTTKGCPVVEPTPTIRLRLILGDSIQKIKNSDIAPGPAAVCSKNAKFVLYLF